MRFMIIRKADAQTEAGQVATQELLAAMGRYNEEMASAGVLREGAGLKPSSNGARIRFQQGRPLVTDGPFTETKEMIAGYTIIEVASREEALEWVTRWPVEDADGNVELELRQLYELEDFPAGEGLDVHLALQERMEQQ